MSKIILCVDDSATMQQVAEITFRGTALTYVGARTAEEALTKAKAQKPALVLADAALGGGKSGYDVCQALKADAGLADVPVVIICGNSTPYDAAKGAQVGAEGTLPKPWDTQVMLEKCVEMAGKGATVKPGAAAPAAAKPAAAPAPAAAAAANQPPRSATIMGMPTIKLPGGGVAQPVAPVAAAAAAAAAAPAPKAPAPVAAAPAPVAAAPAPVAAASSGPVSAPISGGVPGAGRAPMVAGSPGKRSVLVERTMAKMAARLSEVSGLPAGSPELLALLKLSTEVVERIVWEVVPELAEQIIREQVAARQ